MNVKRDLQSPLFHMIGIGGIGMSGVARLAVAMGKRVQGSDLHDAPALRDLRALGIAVAVGHEESHLGEAQAVIVSSAIDPDNPERRAARRRRLPILSRADMLASLIEKRRNVVVSGSHGKTTVSAMIAAMLDRIGGASSFVIGGVVHGPETNARLGDGTWTIVEADESDGTFLRYPCEIAVIASIDAEHLDHYGDMETLRDAFHAFARQTLDGGGAVIACRDDAETAALLARLDSPRTLSYGFDRQADIRIVDHRSDADGVSFDLAVAARQARPPLRLNAMRVAAYGRHNVLNAAAAVAVGVHIGLDAPALRRGLEGFQGVRRRFNRVGQWNGAVIIDDYAHHPTEIAAVLAAARERAQRRLIAVLEPHRPSRLAACFDRFAAAFGDADQLRIVPVYAAGERPVKGCDHHALAAAARRLGHPDAVAVGGYDDLIPAFAAAVGEGDLIVYLGAGAVSAHARALADRLAQWTPKP